MRRSKLVIASVVLLVLLALPATAFARKRVYTARLTTANELHTVVGSSATGSFVIGSTLDASGYRFSLFVRALSGPVTGAHLHAPADTTANAPVRVTLCTIADCTYDSSGNLSVEGVITGPMIAGSGITGAQFDSFLNDGLIYVNVHTALNPAGEARGQVLPVP
jgi:hypothetical protein